MSTYASTPVMLTLLLACLSSTSAQSLGYAYFKFPTAPSNGYESFLGAVDVLADPGSSSDGLFMSHQFFFKGGNGGYMGLQTDGVYDAPLRRTPAVNHTFVHPIIHCFVYLF